VLATDLVLAAPGCLTLRDWCWVCGLGESARRRQRGERGEYMACGEQSGKERWHAARMHHTLHRRVGHMPRRVYASVCRGFFGISPVCLIGHT
jgi:hypothetical protein